MRAQFSDRVFCLQILFYSCVATVWNFHLHLLGVWVLWQLFLLLSLYNFSAKFFVLVWGFVSFYDDRREKCTLVLIEELTASARKPSSTHSEFCFYGFSNLFFAIKLFFLALLASFWASSQCIFFLPNTKLKAYKNHHKDSEGRDFLFHINNAGFLSLITLCQKSIFCQKKNPHFLENFN